MKTTMRVLVLALFCAAVAASGLSAQEKSYELKPAATIKDILSENIGKRVIVRMDAGENVEGTVYKVGDGLVHISKLSGRDFYDAAVRIDRISAVVFKVRGN
jgi:lysophospholipid acyltransferase (LPLAT)-like uncharacterized protein